MISSISSFEIINVFLPDPKILFFIDELVADTATVNANGIKTLLANGLSAFFIKDKAVFSNSPKFLSKNPLDFSILWTRNFDTFVLADE